VQWMMDWRHIFPKPTAPLSDPEPTAEPSAWERWTLQVIPQSIGAAHVALKRLPKIALSCWNGRKRAEPIKYYA
jgi:hypothetical protein